jgi:hypothetical protein
VPDFNDDATFGTEFFRLSGAFSMQINPKGLEMLAVASMEIGPPDLQLFDLDAVGVMVINASGFATDLVITAHRGVDGIAAIDGSFRFVTNVSSVDQEVRVLQRFIDGNYLPQDFIDQLRPTADPDDDPEQMAYVVPAGGTQVGWWLRSRWSLCCPAGRRPDVSAGSVRGSKPPSGSKSASADCTCRPKAA